MLEEPEAARFLTAVSTAKLDGPLLQCITNPTVAAIQPGLCGILTLGYAVFEFNRGMEA